MARLLSVMISEGVAVDALTARLTIFNMLNDIFTARVPALLPRVHVVVTYASDSDAAPFFERTRMIEAGGKEIVMSGPTQIQLTDRIHNSIHALWGARFDQAGEYLVVLEHADSPAGAWREMQRVPLTVHIGPHPLAPKPPEGAAPTAAESKAPHP